MPEEKQSPVITKIEAQKRKGRYNIYLDETYAFSVGEDILTTYMLHKDMELPAKLQKEIVHADTVNKAYQKALNYLSYQLRTEKEMKQYLRKQEMPAESIISSIEKMKEQGLINDKIYAESFVRTMRNTSDKGPYVVKQKLKEKGIHDEIIAAALAEYDGESQLDNAVKLATKLAKKNQNHAFQTRVQKIYLAMQQKGFTSDVIKLALETIELDKDEAAEQVAIEKQGEKIWRSVQRYEPKQRLFKLKQKLYQKGFDKDLIDQFVQEKESKQNDE